MQKDHDRLEKQVDRNLMKFGKGKCKVPHRGKKNPMHQSMLVAIQLERPPSFPEKSWGLSRHQVEQKPAMCPCKKG